PRSTPFDLGLHLKSRTDGLAERVVLHLVNGGDRVFPVTPFKLPDRATLVIYYEYRSDRSEDRRPLILQAVRSMGEPGAVIETSNGGLELTNVELRAPDTGGQKGVETLLRVRGPLRLHQCVLTTDPTGRSPKNLLSLIDCYGTGDAALER